MANTFVQNVQMVGSNSSGDVQGMNVGKSDDSTPIYYELQTQEIEFDNRAHLKKISDEIVMLTDSGIDSFLEARQDDGDFKPIPLDLSDSVNIGEDIKLEGNYFTFKWSGEASETSPIFNGIYLEKVTDLGITKS